RRWQRDSAPESARASTLSSPAAGPPGLGDGDRLIEIGDRRRLDAAEVAVEGDDAFPVGVGDRAGGGVHLRDLSLNRVRPAGLAQICRPFEGSFAEADEAAVPPAPFLVGEQNRRTGSIEAGGEAG